MSDKPEPVVLQRAEEEEYSQARALTTGEVNALIRLTVFLAFAGILLGVLVGGAIGLFVEPLSFAHALWVGAAMGSLLAAIPIVRWAGNEMLKGLRASKWRKAQTFAEPQPKPPPAPSILVHQPGREPYILDRQEPLALTDGRESNLVLDEPTILAILRELIEQRGGNWSRERVMGIKVGGQRVTRAIFDELATLLEGVGLLTPQARGGHRLPDDVQKFDDLVRYFPNLATRRAGRQAGGREVQGQLPPGSQPSGRGETLAERHRRRWLEKQD